MMDVSRRKDGAFDGRAKRPSRPNRAASWTCALYSVASAVEGRGALLRSQGRSLSTRASVPKYVPIIEACNDASFFVFSKATSTMKCAAARTAPPP